MNKFYKILILTFISGSIIFSFARPALAQTPISCGQVIIDSISAAEEKDTYSFTAAANDSVTIRATTTQGYLYAYLELYSPDGTKLIQGRNLIDKTLASAGIYTVVVRDEFNSDTGNYALTWQRLNNPCNANISCGQTINGSIGLTVDNPPWNFYSFDASANDKVSIRATTTQGYLYAYLELYGPDGVRLGGARGQLDATLTLTGKHTIVVRDEYNSDTGDYSLTFIHFNSPCGTSLDCGQTILGAITTTERTKFYSFTAAANDSVTIRATTTQGYLYAYLELYGPDGVRLGGARGQLDATLTLTGKHTIVVRDQYNSDIGNYVLTWQRLNNPCNANNITFGNTISGNINNFVEIDTYKFTVLSNDNLYITFAALSETAGYFSPLLELYDSTGLRLANSSSGKLETTVATAGDIYLLVTDNSRDGAGTYEFTLQRPNNPANLKDLTYNSAIEDSLEVVTGINVYRFTANANDTISICATVKTTTSGSFNPYLELYDTSGNLLVFSQAGFKHTFASGGIFYLFITDPERNGTGIYRIILSNEIISCSGVDLIAPQVSLLQPKAGEIIESGSTYAIKWSSSDDIGVTSQEIRLSTDSGVTYPAAIASGLGAAVQTCNWQIPADLTTSQARIKVTAQDAQGNIGKDENSSDFIIIKATLPAEAKEINYEYDKLNRLDLTNSQVPPALDYEYDALGNRLSLNLINSSPALIPIGNKTTEEGRNLEFTVTAQDPDNNFLTFTHPLPIELPSGATFVDNGDGTAIFRWTPSFNQARVYTVHFEVSDGSLSAFEDVPITVNNVLVFGTIYEKPADTVIPSEGTTVSIVNIFRTQTLASAVTDSQGKFAIVATNVPDGNYIIETSKTGYKLYSGGTLLRNSQALPFSVTLSPPGFANMPPAANIDEGEPYSLGLSATDPNHDKLSFNAANLPEGATFIDNKNNTADFNWTPVSSQAGTHTVNFNVTDGLFTTKADFTIEVKSLNNPPVLSPIPDATVYEGNLLAFKLSASDPDSQDTLTFSCNNLPQGAQLNNLTGDFSWLPDFNQKGQYNITFKVSDGKAGVDSKTANIVVINSSLYGFVLDKFTKEPIPNAQIKVYTKGNLEVAGAATDISGKYVVSKNLPTGFYFIRIAAQQAAVPAKLQIINLTYDQTQRRDFYLSKVKRKAE